MIKIENLSVAFEGTEVVQNLNLELVDGEIVGVVGESGSGKSVSALTLMGLVSDEAVITSGRILFDDVVLREAGKPCDKALYRKYQGEKMSMVFQEPMTSLNPTQRVGKQVEEVLNLHTSLTPEEMKAKVLETFESVGLRDVEKVYASFPHQLSGGMRQRVMIAMALAAEPRLIIADEPTTALDVTIQAQILDLLQDIKTKIDGSILLITHDLGVIAEMADYVVVMYAGKVIEKGTVYEIFQDPRHPYTIGLQKSKPTMTLDDSTELYNIPGNVPNPVNMPTHCYFKERCAKCTAKCSGDYPEMVQISPSHFVACHLYDGEDKNG